MNFINTTAVLLVAGLGGAMVGDILAQYASPAWRDIALIGPIPLFMTGAIIASRVSQNRFTDRRR